MSDETEKRPVAIIYRESLFQSISADVVSFFFLCGSFYVNVHYIGSRWVSFLLLILFWLKIFAYIGSRKNVFTNKEDAIAFLNK